MAPQMAGAASKYQTVVVGTFSWNGGPERPVSVTIAHAPEAHGANDRHAASGCGSCPEKLVVPPPPDYSTPRACSDRALERGTRDPWYLEIVRLGRGKGTYEPFRKAVEKAGGSLSFASDVRDTHESKWAVVANPEWAEWDKARREQSYRLNYEARVRLAAGEPTRYTLKLASEVVAPIVKARKPRAKRAIVAA